MDIRVLSTIHHGHNSHDLYVTFNDLIREVNQLEDYLAAMRQRFCIIVLVYGILSGLDSLVVDLSREVFATPVS
jgi:hypothetical protein